MTSELLVALGEAGILSLEDLAGSATDELVGWTERNQGETVRHKGSLSELGILRPTPSASSWQPASRRAG